MQLTLDNLLEILQKTLAEDPSKVQILIDNAKEMGIQRDLITALLNKVGSDDLSLLTRLVQGAGQNDIHKLLTRHNITVDRAIVNAGLELSADLLDELITSVMSNSSFRGMALESLIDTILNTYSEQLSSKQLQFIYDTLVSSPERGLRRVLNSLYRCQNLPESIGRADENDKTFIYLLEGGYQFSRKFTIRLFKDQQFTERIMSKLVDSSNTNGGKVFTKLVNALIKQKNIGEEQVGQILDAFYMNRYAYGLQTNTYHTVKSLVVDVDWPLRLVPKIIAATATMRYSWRGTIIADLLKREDVGIAEILAAYRLNTDNKKLMSLLNVKLSETADFKKFIQKKNVAFVQLSQNKEQLCKLAELFMLELLKTNSNTALTAI